MAKNKKPTMMEVRDAIAILIRRLDGLYNVVQQSNLTFTEYLTFKEEGDNFTEYLKEKYEKEPEREQEYRDNNELQQKQDKEAK